MKNEGVCSPPLFFCHPCDGVKLMILFFIMGRCSMNDMYYTYVNISITYNYNILWSLCKLLILNFRYERCKHDIMVFRKKLHFGSPLL